MENTKRTEDDIDLVELTKVIWSERKKVFKIQIVFVIISVFVGFTSPIEYISTSKLLPESGSTEFSGLSGGGLAGLAGLAGIDLGSLNESEGIPPQLYPEVILSLPVLMDIMDDTIYFEEKNIHTTPFLYFRDHRRLSFFEFVLKYTIGLPTRIFGSSNDHELKTYSEEILRYSIEDWELIESFRSRIDISIDESTGIISLEVEMPDPVAAAQVAQAIKEQLKEYVIQYNTSKSRRNLEFIEENCEKARLQFEKKQLQFAKISDQNKSITSSVGQIELQKVEYEYTLAYDLYKSLSTELQQAQIKLNHETPVVTVVEPVRIPEKKSSPRKGVILVVFLVLGTFVGVIYISIKQIFSA